jgi:vacuolar protein sorting-associated protein 8
LEVLLEKVFDEAASGQARSTQSDLHSTFAKLGYKAILYLQTCFKGLAFPLDKPLAAEERQQSIKTDLLKFLAREHFVSSSHFKSNNSSSSHAFGLRAEKYPYTRLLLLVDPKATLDTIALGLSSTESSTLNSVLSPGLASNWSDIDGALRNDTPDKQNMIDMLSSIVVPSDGVLDSLSARAPSLVPSFLDFVARYLMDKAVTVRKEIVMMIISRMVSRFVASEDPGRKQLTQKQMLGLFSALPRDSYQPDEALSLIDKADMHRVALLLHQQVASSWYEDDSKDIEVRSVHFQRAIDCYIGDHEDAFRREVFDYVKKECAGLTRRGAMSSQMTLLDALFEKLPSLVRLDPLLSARLVAELFVDDLDHIVNLLESEGGGKTLFRFFRVIISGELMQFDPVAGSVLNLTNQHHEKYLALMAKQHPELVYEYLSTHDNYRPEDCLKLCQKYDIADASAYLLERLGNVSSALQLILQTLESRMMNLKRSIRGMGVDVFRSSGRRVANGRQSTHQSELPSSLIRDVEVVKRILTVALDLCERNSRALSLRSEQGSQLWFNILDRLMNAKGFLRLEKEQPEHAAIIARVVSSLLHLTMQRMVSSVPLNDLVRKISSDSSGSRLGEMREMIDSFIKTYGYELQVFQGASEVFHHDMRNMQTSSRRLALKGNPVRSVGNTPVESGAGADILQLHNRQNVVLSTGHRVGAAFIEVEGASHARRLESGLVSTMSRLRERRMNATGHEIPLMRHTIKGGLNMMTEPELAYLRGECEPVIYGPRPSGILGDAEHRGRLVTFG